MSSLAGRNKWFFFASLSAFRVRSLNLSGAALPATRSPGHRFDTANDLPILRDGIELMGVRSALNACENENFRAKGLPKLLPKAFSDVAFHGPFKIGGICHPLSQFAPKSLVKHGSY